MKLHLIRDPVSSSRALRLSPRFARYSAIGTWSEDNGLCPACTRSTQYRIEPLLIEWEPGSENIGDFSWSGGYTAAVNQHARDVLTAAGFQCRYGRSEVVKPEALGTKKPLVPFPYRGPDLFWLIPTEKIALNEELTGISGTKCAVCGYVKYPFRREGIIINSEALGGRSIFQIEQFGRSEAMFVTDDALDCLRRAELTNIGLHHAGEII